MSSLSPTSRTVRAVVAGLTLAQVALACPASAQRPVQIPAPVGHVSDFARVVPAAQVAHMEALARVVRERSGGEIVIVTLPDIAGRDVADVALQIGREWKVGAKAEIGATQRNAGVVVLVVPKETSSDGQGHISIQTGQGVEGFIPDAVAGDIRREATEYFRQRDYGTGMVVITLRLAERYATEFGFALDSAMGAVPRRTPQRARRQGIPPTLAFVVFIVIVILLSGTRGGCLPIAAGAAMSRHRRSHWSGYGGFGGGGGGFGGGGGGGGFGGFGGGGGFSGGGSSGGW